MTRFKARLIIADKFHICHSLDNYEYKKMKWFEGFTNVLNFLLSLGDKSDSKSAQIARGSVHALLREGIHNLDSEGDK